LNRLTLTIHGPFAAETPDGPVGKIGRRGQPLLAFHALEPRRRASRSAAMTLLWGDRSEEQARVAARKSPGEVTQQLLAQASLARADELLRTGHVDQARDLLTPMVRTIQDVTLRSKLPDLLLRDEAEKRRRAFRHTLSSYLDLVNVLLAGGAGIETALHAAADAGDGWGYQTIRGELRRARLTGQSPWDTFAQLNARFGINELAELAASVSLAGSHGARIRASLAAKADTLRGHQVAETEAAAEAATERMTVPVAVLLFGFLVFIAYPAVVQITSVSGPQP